MAKRGIILLAWNHWHIEVSSICTLKCPRCPRAEVDQTLLNKQLSLEFFQQQIGASVIEQIQKITFCGNDGDPIYCREFLEICSWIKQVNPAIQLVIITNGSYKTSNWWKSLGNILNHNDEVHWSIDGVDQETNQQYRVNCDWNSIVQGIESFRSVNKSTYRVWAAIGFRFNQQLTSTQAAMAKDLGFDLYQLTKSTKFGSKYPDSYGTNDLLEPTDPELISSSFRFERSTTVLSTRSRPGQQLRIIFKERADKLKLQSHGAICMIGNKGVFVNSQGHFYPCCWVANRYPHNNDWQHRASTQFDLKSKTFEEILKDTYWTTDFLKFDNLECQTKCTTARLDDPHHTLDW